MAGRSPSFRDDTLQDTSEYSNVIDLTQDSPRPPSYSAGNDQCSSPSQFCVLQGTTNLRPSLTMKQQHTQSGSPMHNANIQLYQDMNSMNPQSRRAAQQYIGALQAQRQNQWPGALTGNGQQHAVSGPNLTQSSSMTMGPVPPMIAHHSATIADMRDFPQQFGSYSPKGIMGTPQSPFVQNDMALFGQDPNAIRLSSEPSGPAHQLQHGQQQMQQQSRVQDERMLLARTQQQHNASQVQYTDVAHDANFTTGKIPFSISTLPQPKQKRTLNNAGGPPPKRQATQSPGMESTQRTISTTQHQQMGQNSHTPFAINRDHDMSAAMTQQPGLNLLASNALVGDRNTSAAVNQMAGISSLSPEQAHLLQCRTKLNQQSMEQSMHSTQNPQHVQNQRTVLNVQNSQAAYVQQGFKVQQGRQYVQQQLSIQHPLLAQKQDQRQFPDQQRQQNRSINEQRTHGQHQSNTQNDATSKQKTPCLQQRQRAQNAQQYMPQKSIDGQPQTSFEQKLNHALKNYTQVMVRKLRQSRGQNPNLDENPTTTDEIVNLRPHLLHYRSQLIAQSRNRAAAQIVASNHFQFLQQNSQHQMTPQQMQQQQVQQQQVQQIPRPQVTLLPQQTLEQLRRAQQIHLPQQTRIIQESERTLTCPQAFEQSQTHSSSPRIASNKQQARQQSSSHQQQTSQHETQQGPAVSGPLRDFVPPISSSVVDPSKIRQEIVSGASEAQSFESPSSSRDRLAHLGSSPPQQELNNPSLPRDDLETRLKEGLQTFFRESASPTDHTHDNSSSSDAAPSSTTQGSSLQSVSRTSAPVMTDTPQSGSRVTEFTEGRYPTPDHSRGATAAGSSNASTSQRGWSAPSPAARAVVVQQNTASSATTLHTGIVNGRGSGEQCGLSLEPATPVVPNEGFRRERSVRVTEDAAVTNGAPNIPPSTTIAGHDSFSNFTNPGADWQLLDNAEVGYGLFDAGPDPVILPDDAWVAAAPPSYPPIRFPEEEGVDRLLALSNILVPPLSLQNLRPETMGVGETGNAGGNLMQDIAELAQRVEVDWDGIGRYYLAEVAARREEALRHNQKVEKEGEPVVEIEAAFASSNGPMTSAVDAFTHRVNQELGVGWEVHYDPSLFRNRESGTVDPVILQGIADGTYAPTVFEFGPVHAVKKPKTDVGAIAGSK
ncbi:hypothetical protein FKW77_009557 [Venturia effusa]|uniref:Uncharacterized protein n=1 Tax=Venturia effusa TaxID=50376 RepID=A0A517LBN6_9PEZI|nr:hypothetical protein FKW77_009557 [Venturia effusa]